MRLLRIRLTIWRMMVATAIVAVLCTAAPYPFADPIATLAAVLVVGSIFAILGHRQDPRLFKYVLFLALVTGLATAAREIHAVWARAASYRRLSDHHARLESICRKQVQSFDADPRKFGGKERWQISRPRWWQWVEYHESLAGKYDRAARSPWVPIDADPPPP